MTRKPKIDLAYYFDPGMDLPVTWELGNKRALEFPLKHLAFTVDCLLKQTDAEWILLWDFSLGEPDKDLLLALAQKQVDVWHAGLKLGLSGRPRVLDSVDPVWMYNKDAGKDTEHTNFRLSLRACLIRTSVLRKAGNLSPCYASLEMAGVALGYSLLRQGGILRYHPHIVRTGKAPESIPEKDEWVFARQFFTKKWQLWSVLNSGKPIGSFKLWRGVSNVQPLPLRPLLHSSEKPSAYEAPKATVSVLVPTLDRYSYIMNELEQLANQTILPLEVLITDQTDRNKRTKIDFTKYPNLNIKFFPQDEKGQVLAWNKLLEESSGEYVLFLGDDADGIEPDFIEKLLLTQQRFDCDMVASNVIELGIRYEPIDPYYFLTDTFPITLIKKSVLLKTGFMDMFFNRNVRADGDLAMRCHLSGALMIFDPSASIYHHRAPAGGLRAHKARVVTGYMSKNSLTKIILPTSSEIYLRKKYFSPRQFKNSMRIKYLSLVMINGGIFRKMLRALIMLSRLPSIRKQHKQNLAAADEALRELNR